jgi:hypothetical protein
MKAVGRKRRRSVSVGSVRSSVRGELGVSGIGRSIFRVESGNIRSGRSEVLGNARGGDRGGVGIEGSRIKRGRNDVR